MRKQPWKKICSLLALSFPLIGQAAQTCTVDVPTPVDFGNYNPFSVLNDSTTGTLSVTCNGTLGTVNYNISLSAGNSGSVATRHMLNGSQTLDYNLYTNLLHTQIWGNDTVSGICLVVLPFTPCVNNHSIYGLLPTGQTDAGPGDYVDDITVTVTY